MSQMFDAMRSNVKHAANPSWLRSEIDTLFAPAPSWSSNPTNQTLAVAWGDVDGDGDLDLACGNGSGFGQSNTVYLNADGALAPTPSWSSGPASLTHSVAWGDVDGDGDLDLACGNFGRNVLYLNEGGILASTPSWSSDPSNFTESVAWADVDGDGDLDLACGNNGQSNTLYLNDGGVLATTPAWSSDPTNATESVAWGDVDGDGDLDLACGNGNRQSNTLYLNSGGILARAPAWSSGALNTTTSVAFGDVNGDGALDLVCGNGGSSGQSNTLYLNEAGTFATLPSWSSGSANATESVVLGDLDGDGDLDLACANSGSLGQSNTLYENENGAFAPTPSWSSAPSNSTGGVAWGDVDGDGDLDLACGNEGQSNTLYLNERTALSSMPSWSSGLTNLTVDVALGDVDGDGDLDLVCANTGQNTLYLNERDSLATMPSWSSDATNVTWGVALGDVDGDGDLDLVCGNRNASNTLYLNEDGTFGSMPAWSSGPANDTFRIALGDVDGDGDLDLVCANDGQNTLYLNEGGVFGSMPSWRSGLRNTTFGVALGDVDGDGDLDLLCGNGASGGNGDRNTLYLNEGGVFASTPSWSSGLRNTTISLALGDVDGDGDLDVAFGNGDVVDVTVGIRNTLYLNDGGTLASTPSWSSTLTNTTLSIAWGDVDGDGDLDLVCGNGPARNTLYLNEGGALESMPSWSSGPEIGAAAVALGDVDGDGNLDLVCGNAGGPGRNNTLFESLKWPTLKGALTNPAHHLPNNTAHLRWARARRDPEGAIQVDFEAMDVESDPIHVTAEFQFVGEPRWFPVELNALPVGSLQTSPAGVSYTAVVNERRIPFDSRDVILRLRTLENPQRVSSIQYGSIAYSIPMGRVNSPRIETSADAMVFPVVTVGDTVSASITISNTGNGVLMLEAVEFPTAEMEHNLRLPVALPPGDRVQLEVSHHPVVDLGTSGDIVIRNNDASTPALRIATQRNPRSLEFTSRLLPDTVPSRLGEPLIVLVVPAESVRLERGFLYLRRPGAEPDTLDLVRSGNDLVATIPGRLVTELGFEYWIDVRNDPAIVTDPPDAPASRFAVQVEPPSTITTQAVSGSGFFAVGAAFRIDVDMQRGALIQQGRVHYRRGGETAYQGLMLDLVSSNQGSAIIPAAAVTERGVEYWVEVATQTDSLVDPIARGDAPRTVRTTIQSLQEPETYAGGAYRMVSIPMDFTAQLETTLETLLSDQPSFGPYDPTVWRSFRWLPAPERYQELESLSTDEVHRVRPGRAFWLVSRSAHQVEIRAVGRSTRTDDDFEIVLSPGWNQIGSPFAFAVAWADVASDAAPGIIETPLHWDGGSQYEDATLLEPFSGYFVMNNGAQDVAIRIPPVETNASTNKAPALGKTDSWRGEIVVTADGMTDLAVMGLASGASTDWDPADRSDPPGIPGRSVSPYFPHSEWDTQSKAFSTDVHGLGVPESKPFGAGHVWRFDVAKNFTSLDGGDPVLLSFAGIDAIPEEARVVLLDHDLGREIDLRESQEHRFILGKRRVVPESEARFAFIVGEDAFVQDQLTTLAAAPHETRLLQNQPNPFRHGTLIRYDLGTPGPVEVLVYDVRGRLVHARRPQPSKPGRYEMAWDGRDTQGRRVPAGLYFYRLHTPHFSETRKMLIVR